MTKEEALKDNAEKVAKFTNDLDAMHNKLALAVEGGRQLDKNDLPLLDELEKDLRDLYEQGMEMYSSWNAICLSITETGIVLDVVRATLALDNSGSQD